MTLTKIFRLSKKDQVSKDAVEHRIWKTWKDISRRARLVADGTGLENRKGFTLLVGSNPTPSALEINGSCTYK